MPSALDELQKNDDIDTSVETLGYRGEGVARVGRVPVFVQGALPGERIRAHIILVKKDYAVGKLTDVSSPSPDRVDPAARTSASAAGATYATSLTPRSWSSSAASCATLCAR